MREGYGGAQLRADAIAGLTVAIVALPLSLAIAIASGASPAQGLVTAGGFLVSALGGSRFQIGGPAGAFIVLIATTVSVHGMAGLTLAVAMSGIMLAAIGLMRLGAYRLTSLFATPLSTP